MADHAVANPADETAADPEAESPEDYQATANWSEVVAVSIAAAHQLADCMVAANQKVVADHAPAGTMAADPNLVATESAAAP